MIYKSCFLLSQTDTKKLPTPLYQELHSLFTNIPCFSPKHNAALAKFCHKKGFKSIWRKDLLQLVPKISLWESYDAHLKRTYLTSFLQVPQLGHSCDSSPLACLSNSSNSSWVPKRNFKKQSRRCFLCTF